MYQHKPHNPLHAHWRSISAELERHASGVSRDPTPITGPFGLLPPELIDLVALQILWCRGLRGVDLQEAARESANAFCTYLSLAKGFRVVSHETRLEAIARVYCTTPDFSWRAHPFLAQCMDEIEARITAREMLLALRLILTQGTDHYGDVLDRVQNRKWSSADPNEPSAAMQRAIDKRIIQMQVAWRLDGTLLCACPGGAVVASPDRIMALTGDRARTLLSHTDLHVSFSQPISQPVSHAASSGSLLVFATQKANEEGPDEHAYVLQTWDMSRHMLIDEVEELGDLEHLWVTPWGQRACLVTSKDWQWLNRAGEVKLRRSEARVKDAFVYEHAIVSRKDTLVEFAPCAATGCIAMLTTSHVSPPHATPWKQSLCCLWPMRDQRNLTLGGFKMGTFESTHPDNDSVDMSARGDVVVVAGRGHVEPKFLVYQRKGHSGWILRNQITVEDAYGWGGVHWIVKGTVRSTFSPCGSLYMVATQTVHVGILVLNIEDAVREPLPGTPRQDMRARFWRGSPSAIPRALVWSNGIWMETKGPHGSNHGVKRLGFCQREA